MRSLVNNFGQVAVKNPQLSKLHKQLNKQAQPKKLIALKRTLARKANKVQLKPKMHDAMEFREATSLGMKDKFPFGKYKDRTLRHIVKTDPMWLAWIMDNMGDKIRLSATVLKEIAAFATAEMHDVEEGAQVQLEEGQFIYADDQYF